MKKHYLLLSMLAIGYTNAQTAEELKGRFGFNTETPKATADFNPNEQNAVETATTNQGILAPRLSKKRIANILDSQLAEGTLVYATDDTESPISSYTGTNDKVKNITEKGYYFYNGTEWVKVQHQDNEWEYDATNKQMKLKRISNLLGNNVFYNKYGALQDYNFTSYKYINSYNNNYSIDTANVDYSNRTASSLYRKTSTLNLPASSEYNMLLNLTYVDKMPNEGMRATSHYTCLYTDPESEQNHQELRGARAEVLHQGKGKVGYLLGGFFRAGLNNGSSDGAVFGMRTDAIYHTKKSSEYQIPLRAVNAVGTFSGGTIKEMIDIYASKNFENESLVTVNNLKGVNVANHIQATSPVSIKTAKGFHYEGLNIIHPVHSVENNYGLHIENIAGGTVSNYAIYTEAGKVRLGDNVGIGIDNPNEKLEVNGAVKVSSTSTACTSANVGTIKFENDNFYGCKSTGWVLLNN